MIRVVRESLDYLAFVLFLLTKLRDFDDDVIVVKLDLICWDVLFLMHFEDLIWAVDCVVGVGLNNAILAHELVVVVECV